MQKMYAGARLRRLREERGLTQTSLANTLGLSVSYVNQLENDHRPLTVPVLLRLNTAFDLDVAFFAADTDARLLADLHDVLAENPETADVSATEVDELLSRSPFAVRALVGLHRRLQGATAQLDGLIPGDRHLDQDTAATTPYEEVRDFFYDRRNHIPELDEAAENLFRTRGLTIGGLDLQLSTLLHDEHGITVVIRTDEPDRLGPKRTYDPGGKVLTLARRLSPGQRAFQLATQLAFLTHGHVIEAIVSRADSLPERSRALARVGLANYFAGALILPYNTFLRAAETLHYDIDLLGAKFEVGFETVCHRLSTLQRPRHRGVPFFFVRTDRAGNISKRQSATAFHFSRVGGSCPLWVVHEAFASPGRILTQVSQMPDGRTYLWISRTTHEGSPGFLAPKRDFAIGLGCDIAYADKLVYSRGLRMDDQGTTVPIGAGCKVCDRPSCTQRAFPHLGRPILIDENSAGIAPYSGSHGRA